MTEPLVQGVLSRNKPSVAQALNLVEDVRAEKRDEIERLLAGVAARAQAAHYVGITGPPGVGKSTLTSALIHAWRGRGQSVGVVAVDPSSKRSGGALLGDRARIRYDVADAGVFVRSMAAGEQLGGLARATQAAAQVLGAAFDVVVVETVGVGQSETDIEDVADTVVFVVQPGSGDSLQFMKSGIMEIPDVLVVNKADEDKLARRASLDLKGTLVYREKAAGGWEPKVVRTAAIDGQGVPELADALAAHRAYLTHRGLAAVRAEKAARWALAAYTRYAGERGLEALGGRAAVQAKLQAYGALGHRELLRKLLAEA
jgi:LAO/AO transport system kinase